MTPYTMITKEKKSGPCFRIRSSIRAFTNISHFVKRSQQNYFSLQKPSIMVRENMSKTVENCICR